MNINLLKSLSSSRAVSIVNNALFKQNVNCITSIKQSRLFHKWVVIPFLCLFGAAHAQVTVSDEINDSGRNSYFWVTLNPGAGTASATDTDLIMANGYRSVDLSSPDLSCVRVNDGSKWVYQVTWTGNSLLAGGQADTLEFNIVVEAFSGADYVYEEGNGSVNSLGSVADLTEVNNFWGVAGDDDIDEGESIRMTIEDVTVGGLTPDENELVLLKKFTSMVARETNGGSAHNVIFGEGSGLHTVSFNSDAHTEDVDSESFSATGAGSNTIASQWAIEKMNFRLVLRNSALVVEDPDFYYSDIKNGHTFGATPYLPTTQSKLDNGFPEFSWDKVPITMLIRKASTPFTDDEARRIAKRYDFVVLEKANGGIEGYRQKASALKAYNPDIKVVFYWNSRIYFGHQNVDNSIDANVEDYIDQNNDIRGQSIYNRSNLDFIDWWVGVAHKMMGEVEGLSVDGIPFTPSSIDGCFIDKTGLPLSMLEPLYEGASDDKFVMNNNGDESRDRIPYLDGTYREGWHDGQDRDKLIYSIALAKESGKSQKLTMLRNIDRNPGNEREMEDAADFPLAYFLMYAEKYSYLFYFKNVDATAAQYTWLMDYPDQYQRPLGSPLGDAIRDDDVYCRSFEHADAFYSISPRANVVLWKNDVGNPSLAGSGFSHTDGSYSLQGSGNISSGSDQFFFLSDLHYGNGSVTAKIDPLENANIDSKAGVMFRERSEPVDQEGYIDAYKDGLILLPGARMAAVVKDDLGQMKFIFRSSSNGDVETIETETADYGPYAKLVRVNDLYIGYSSPDGVSWSEIGRVDLAMGEKVEMGMAVTSGDSSVLTTAGFSSFAREESEPVASDISVEVQEDSNVSFAVSGAEPNGGSVTYQLLTEPSEGTLSGTLPNLVYTPSLDYSGSDSFTYSVSDDFAGSNIATVSITVASINDRPEANDQSIGVDANEEVSFTLSGHDVDNVDSSLITKVLTNPLNGTLSGTAPNIVYTPNAGFSGVDSFTFNVSIPTLTLQTGFEYANGTLGAIGSNAKNLNGSNDQVGLWRDEELTDVTADFLTVDSSGALLADVAGADYAITIDLIDSMSLDGSNLSFDYGTRRTTTNSVKDNDLVGYDSNGVELFRLRMSGKSSGSNDNTRLGSVNQLGVVNWDLDTVTGTDADGDIPFTSNGPNATISISLEASGYAVSLTGANSYTTSEIPYNGGGDLASLQFSAQPLSGFYLDNIIATQLPSVSEVGNVSIKVRVPNEAPTTSDQEARVTEGESLAITLKGDDINGDILSYEVLTSPLNGVISGSEPNLIYTPNSSFTGVDSFSYKVSSTYIAFDTSFEYTGGAPIGATGSNAASLNGADHQTGEWVDEELVGVKPHFMTFTELNGGQLLSDVAEADYSITAKLIDDIDLNGTTVSFDYGTRRSTGNHAKDNSIVGYDSQGVEVFRVVVSADSSGSSDSMRLGTADQAGVISWDLDTVVGDDADLDTPFTSVGVNTRISLFLGDTGYTIRLDGPNSYTTSEILYNGGVDLASIGFEGHALSGFYLDNLNVSLTESVIGTVTIIVDESVSELAISPVGAGSGYDITPTEAKAFRSTSVIKSFDADGNHTYGSAGYFFYGNVGDSSKNTERFPSWVTAIGAVADTVWTSSDYTDFDNPSVAVSGDVEDWLSNGIGQVNTLGTTGGLWAELLTFTIGSNTPSRFRVGVMAGNNHLANGRWDPAALRLSFEGGSFTEVSDLPVTDLGMVFFDIVLPEGLSGTFTIEGQTRDLNNGTRGPSIAGITFDEFVDSSSYHAWINSFSSGVSFDATEDPDLDGIPLLLEYVLGGTPNGGDRLKLPSFTLDESGLNLSFERNASSSDDTTLIIQYSSLLTNTEWVDIDLDDPTASEVILGDVLGGMQEVSVNIAHDNEVDGKLFYRLKVVTK